MRKVVHTVRETDSLRDAHGLMRLIGIRHLPVVDASGAVVGVVSNRDIHRGWTSGLDQPIASVMTRSLAWAHPSTSARDAAGVMLDHKIGCLPVLDDERRLVGIVTETDFLEVAHRALTLVEALRQLEAP